MRLNELAQYAWDVRVAFDPLDLFGPFDPFDPFAAIPADAAAVLTEHLAGGLGFLVGFIGKADALPGPAVVDIEGSGYGLVVNVTVAVVPEPADPTATFICPLEAAMRMIGGRLRPANTPRTSRPRAQ